MELRSCEGAKKWVYNQVVNAQFMRSLRDTIGQLSDSSVLVYCGFTPYPPSMCWPEDAQDPDHPRTEAENELATNMGDLVLSLIASRLRNSCG